MSSVFQATTEPQIVRKTSRRKRLPTFNFWKVWKGTAQMTQEINETDKDFSYFSFFATDPFRLKNVFGVSNYD
jgi:hypothetical protein